MKEKNFLDISWGTILKIGIAFFFFLIIYQIREILTTALFAIIISTLFEPAIIFLEKKGINRKLSVPLVYFSFFIFLGFLVFYLSNPIFIEIKKLASSIPQYFERISPFFKEFGLEALENFENLTFAIQQWLIKASSSIFSAISVIFGGFFATLTIFSLSLFISLEKGLIEKIIKFFAPQEKEEKFLNAWQRVQTKISLWFAIRILGCLFVSLLTFITLKVFKVDYAFSLSILTGFFNLIPILGPVFSGTLVTIFLVMDSFLKAIFFIVAFILIQQLEGNVLLPVLTNRFIEMSPFLVLLSLLIGGKILGFWGAILAIPLSAIIFEFLKEFLSEEIS